jgi:hypothetical protein
MSNVVEVKSIKDYLVDIHRRISRLETGAKPIMGIAERASTGAINLSAGADITGLSATLSWTDSGSVAVVGAVPYLSIFVDNDLDPAYMWPSGVSLSSGQKNLTVVGFMDDTYLNSNPNSARYRLYLKNNDSGAHNYYAYINFTYVTGGGGLA